MADLILYKANVITMDSGIPRAELIALERRRILAVGSNDDLPAFRGIKTRLIDCEGGTIVPGFNDAHCHILAFARSLLSVDCASASVRSIEDIKARIRHRAQQTPPGSWIIATGYNEFYLPGKRHPTRLELDEAAPHHPVKLNHRSGHACVLNSQALQLAGITRETPDPPGGLIDRDLETGEPSGLLFEMNYSIDKVIPPPTDTELRQGIKLANDHYLSLGITSLQDATADNDFRRWQDFLQLQAQGQLASRVSLMISPAVLSEFKEQGLSFGSGNEWLRLGAVKIVLDETTGTLNPPQEELNLQVLQAHQAGFQVALHAIEETTVEAAATALEFALSTSSRSGHRHRIEHCSICPPPLMKRLKDLQAVVVTQPPFIYYSGERYLAEVPTAQLKWLYRFKSFWDNGLKPAASSDSPVVPPNPLTGIYAAATRKAETGQVILAEERLSPAQALAMYTTNAAFAAFSEETGGTISPGKLADMIVLSGDPTKVALEEIKDIQVLMTIVEGELVWEK